MLSETIYEGVCGDIAWRVAEHPDFLAWCGYVRLPEDHPWRGMDAEDIPVDVHGGVTYGPDGDGWIGFDTLHAGDALIPRHTSEPRPVNWWRQVPGMIWTPTRVKLHTWRFAVQADDAYAPVRYRRLMFR